MTLSGEVSGTGDLLQEENVEIDWVLAYDFSDLDLATATKDFRTLIFDLENHGLQAQVRHGDGASVLVLIRVPRNLLGNEVYRSRVKDWLFGLTHARPLGDASTVIEADTATEALRSVYHLVTWTHEQGGAGITAGLGQWDKITASFAPHSPVENAALLRRLAGKAILSSTDIDEIRAQFGERVAFYYAFIQSYSLFLALPAALGFCAWSFFKAYSSFFATAISIWSIVFVGYWRRQETDFAIRWDVKGVGALKVNRPQYVWDEEITDPTTGEKQKRFSAVKRLRRQLLFLPFAALAGIALGTMLIGTFALEAWMNDIYSGGLKEHWIGGKVFQFLPTILLSLSLPFITSFVEDLATKLSDHENHRTADEYELAQVQKSFVLNFVSSFLPIILTAYVYVPFGEELMPKLLELILPASWLTNIHITGTAEASIAAVHPEASRLKEEVIYLSMTAQLMNFGEEIVVPYIQRQARSIYRRWKLHRSEGYSSPNDANQEARTLLHDKPHEKRLMTRLRAEADMEPYDVQGDIMEMVIQFGNLTLFSPVWPLMPLGFLINNWVELRGDFWKLVYESQRPPPKRSQGIGSCLGALEFLTWIGALSSAALVYIYRGVSEDEEIDATKIGLGGLLLSVFLAEQAFLASRFLVSYIFDKIGSETLRDHENRRYVMRKKFLETFSEEAAGTTKRTRKKTYAGERFNGRLSAANSPMASPAIGAAPSPLPESGSQKSLQLQPPSQDNSGLSPFPTLASLDTTGASAAIDEPQQVERQYKTEAAEQFWERPEGEMSTTDQGVQLIGALKQLHKRKHEALEAEKHHEEEGEKAKWT